MDRQDAADPPDDGRLGHLLPGLSRISQTIRKTIVTITEPLSPTHNDGDIESATSAAGPEKSGRWSTHHSKGANVTIVRPRTPERPRTLMNLPHELQIMILGHLEFGDIMHLRRTCKYWYNFATPKLIRSIYGPDTYRAMLIQHCHICLAYCPKDVTRIVTTRLDAGFPFSSRCLKCTVQARDGTVRIGRKVKLGNFIDYWTCRWCGWPVTSDPSSSHAQFHRKCYDKYAAVLLAFFLLGWLQFTIGIVASGMSWHYFKGDRMVIGPTIPNFVLMWLCIFLIMFRGNRVRTYGIALVLELLIAALWIPPIYTISKRFSGGHSKVPYKAAVAMVTFIGLNMLFRFLNIVGNLILIFEYDRTKHYVPRIPVWRRFMNPIMTALIFWTYPQHFERRSPPEWN